MDNSALKALIWRTVQALNRTWTRDPEARGLEQYFHPGMVAITPADRLRLESGEACLAGWRKFAREFEVLRWEEKDPDVRFHCEGRCAVVTYYYGCEIRLRGGGPTLEVPGRDMLVLVLEQDRWLVVADQFSGFPGQG